VLEALLEQQEHLVHQEVMEVEVETLHSAL
jgi:hypothetical protein